MKMTKTTMFLSLNNYNRIVKVIKDFAKMENSERDFARVSWLLDEFSYLFEDIYPNFKEIEFRKVVDGDDDVKFHNEPLVCVFEGCSELQTADGEYCDKHYPV